MAEGTTTTTTSDKPYTGLTAAVKIGTQVLAYINGLNLDMDKEIIDILQFGARFREKVPAIKNWTASVEGTAAFAKGGTQEALYNAYDKDTKVTLIIQLSEGNFFTGDAYVSRLSIDAAPDDTINISAEFEGTGSVTLTLATT